MHNHWRRGCVVLLALACSLLAAAAAYAGEPRGKISRVGILRAGSPVSDYFMEPFRQGLRDLGYVEGQNILLEFRWAEGKSDSPRWRPIWSGRGWISS